jgi:RNA polymerase sigma-70 factor (ECF subfamily)
MGELPVTRVLFERYGAMVYRRCVAILKSDDAARDAVQEVFLRVIERRHQFRGESAPSTWLYAVATLHCLQLLRDQAGRRAKLATLDPTPAVVDPGPEEYLALVELLDSEPEEVRLMVYLHYVDGMTMDEIATTVGYSRKTVSRRVQSFLAAARARLVHEAGVS